MYILNLRLWMVMSLNSNTQIIKNVWKQIRILEYGTRLYLVVKKHFTRAILLCPANSFSHKWIPWAGVELGTLHVPRHKAPALPSVLSQRIILLFLLIRHQNICILSFLLNYWVSNLNIKFKRPSNWLILNVKFGQVLIS